MSAQTWIDGWQRQDATLVAEAFSTEGVRTEFARPGARLVGRDAIAAQAQLYMDAVPGELDVRGRHEDGDTAIVEWTYRGTHSGDAPSWPADGRVIRLEGISVFRIEGGLIADERVYWDAANLFGLMDAADG